MLCSDKSCGAVARNEVGFLSRLRQRGSASLCSTAAASCAAATGVAAAAVAAGRPQANRLRNRRCNRPSRSSRDSAGAVRRASCLAVVVQACSQQPVLHSEAKPRCRNRLRKHDFVSQQPAPQLLSLQALPQPLSPQALPQPLSPQALPQPLSPQALPGPHGA